MTVKTISLRGESVELAPVLPKTPPRQWGCSPEPVELYGQIVHTFETHIGGEKSDCCLLRTTPWPCDQIRLAFRLREGF